MIIECISSYTKTNEKCILINLEKITTNNITTIIDKINQNTNISCLKISMGDVNSESDPLKNFKKDFINNLLIELIDKSQQIQTIKILELTNVSWKISENNYITIPKSNRSIEIQITQNIPIKIHDITNIKIMLYIDKNQFISRNQNTQKFIQIDSNSVIYINPQDKLKNMEIKKLTPELLEECIENANLYPHEFFRNFFSKLRTSMTKDEIINGHMIYFYNGMINGPLYTESSTYVINVSKLYNLSKDNIKHIIDILTNMNIDHYDNYGIYIYYPKYKFDVLVKGNQEQLISFINQLENADETQVDKIINSLDDQIDIQEPDNEGNDEYATIVYKNNKLSISIPNDHLRITDINFLNEYIKIIQQKDKNTLSRMSNEDIKYKPQQKHEIINYMQNLEYSQDKINEVIKYLEQNNKETNPPKYITDIVQYIENMNAIEFLKDTGYTSPQINDVTNYINKYQISTIKINISNHSDGTYIKTRYNNAIEHTNKLLNSILTQCPTVNIVDITCYIPGFYKGNDGHMKSTYDSIIMIKNPNQKKTIKFNALHHIPKINIINSANINLHIYNNIGDKIQINESSFEYKKDNEYIKIKNLSTKEKKLCIDQANKCTNNFINTYINQIRKLMTNEEIINSHMLHLLPTYGISLTTININELENFTLRDIQCIKDKIQTSCLSFDIHIAGRTIISQGKMNCGNIYKENNEIFKLLDSLVGKNQSQIKQILQNSDLVNKKFTKPPTDNNHNPPNQPTNDNQHIPRPIKHSYLKLEYIPLILLIGVCVYVIGKIGLYYYNKYNEDTNESNEYNHQDINALNEAQSTNTPDNHQDKNILDKNTNDFIVSNESNIENESLIN